jgi:hypothetical protein
MPVTTDPETRPGRWWQRLAWFVAIWAGSVAALGVVAWLLRLAIPA